VSKRAFQREEFQRARARERQRARAHTRTSEREKGVDGERRGW
jgi:hypothetical protein